MRKAVLAGVAAVSLTGGAIAAPSGAPQDGPMQAGAWGPGGWQSGATALEPMAPSSTLAPAPMGPGPMGPGPMGPPPMMHGPMHGDGKPVHPGQKLKGAWRDSALTVADWQAWGLGAPGPGMRWIRYYDDAVLVDADDRVVTARGGIPWDAPRHDGYGHHGDRHDDMSAMGGMGGPGWHQPPIIPGTTTYRAGPDTTVTTQVIAPPVVYGGGYAPGYGYGAGYGYASGGATVIVTPGIVTTTTTTTTERVWHKVRVRGCGCTRPIRSGKLVRR